jgi:hypothetical protein
MNALSPIQQLDAVLFLMQEKERGLITFDHIISRLIEIYSNEINGDIIRRSIEKLVRDKYLYEKQRHTGDVDYAITLEGLLFSGYEAKALSDATAASMTQTEIDRRRTLDVLLASNSTRLNVLTNRLFWATVAATLVAIGVLIWYIWSYEHPIRN